MECVIIITVVSLLWVWNASSLTISQSESLIEIWAVLKLCEVGSDIFLFLLNLIKLVVCIAVVIDLWVWNSSCPSIFQCESLVKIWAMLKAIHISSPVDILYLKQRRIRLDLRFTSCSNIWILRNMSLAVFHQSAVWILWTVR